MPKGDSVTSAKRRVANLFHITDPNNKKAKRARMLVKLGVHTYKRALHDKS